MENSTKYILIALVVFAVLFSAAFVYQQKMIMDLRNNNCEIGSARDPAQIDHQKEIKGLITAIKDKTFSVEAEVADLSKLDNARNGNLSNLPKTKKNFTVAVDEKTEYPSIEFQKLEVGMEVWVISEEAVYKRDKLTASKIMVLSGLPNSVQEAVESQKKIAGTIKEIGDNYLIVEMRWLDYTKISDPKNVDPKTAPTIAKEYKVFINDKTVYAIDKNSLKTGDAVIAHSDSPTFSVTEFTAVKIEKPK